MAGGWHAALQVRGYKLTVHGVAALVACVCDDVVQSVGGCAYSGSVNDTRAWRCAVHESPEWMGSERGLHAVAAGKTWGGCKGLLGYPYILESWRGHAGRRLCDRIAW